MKKLLITLAIILTSTSLACGQVVPKPMEDVNHVTDLTLDSLNKAQTVRPIPGSSRIGNNPVLFLVGNSTMRTGTLGNGNNGQWGWGYFEHEFFDENKITVENQALGGTSSRTFYNKLWPDVRKALKSGDWVIIELGHNDNGPYDSGRARASIPGISHDSLNVTIKETGVKETVYTYGEYMRRFIKEVKAAGAHPILFSLTPRNAWEENDTTKIVRVNKTFGLWAKQVAEAENIPFIDLNDISARKLEKYGHHKVDYHFYLDHIHSSVFGAKMNARSAAEGIYESKNSQLAFLQSCFKPLVLPAVSLNRDKGKPVVFITGDSTVKNEDRDENGMWGWGSQAYTIFDKNKITVANCAKAGRSARTFLNEGRWDEVYNSIQPGDYVLIQFGHNDVGDIDKNKERGDIIGTSDSSHVYKLASNGKYEVVYTFGWYLRKFIEDVREKGGTPILLSLTPRNEWKNGKIERRNDTYGKWYRDVVTQTDCEFVDVHNISADFLDKKGQQEAAAYYNHDHTHTSLLGAQNNAKSVAKGLKKMKSPLAKYLK
jgi:lysophospholipase L1-like esterase